MSDPGLREILPGFLQWSHFSDQKGIDFNGTIVVADDQVIVIDPPPGTAAVETALRDLGPIAAYLITNRHHRRDTASWLHRRRVRGMPGCDVVDASSAC